MLSIFKKKKKKSKTTYQVIHIYQEKHQNKTHFQNSILKERKPFSFLGNCSSLVKITHRGTEQQYQFVKKYEIDPMWTLEVFATILYCEDFRSAKSEYLLWGENISMQALKQSYSPTWNSCVVSQPKYRWWPSVNYEACSSSSSLVDDWVVWRNKDLRASNKSTQTFFSLGLFSHLGCKTLKGNEHLKLCNRGQILPSNYPVCVHASSRLHTRFSWTSSATLAHSFGQTRTKSCRDTEPLATVGKTHATQPAPPTPHRHVIDDRWRFASSNEPGWPPWATKQ